MTLETPPPQNPNYLDIALTVHNSRRALTNLSLEHIGELAAAVIVLDHELNAARQQMVTMLQDNPSQPARKRREEKTVYVAAFRGHSVEFTAALTTLVEKRDALAEVKFSPQENNARQQFEKAADRVAELAKINGSK